MITPEMLTGRSTDHLMVLKDKHRLQPDACKAFLLMQKQAEKAGFDLQPASTFRDFDRQLAIWNGKFNGERPVLDKQSCPVDVSDLNDEQRCSLILHWSAIPGTSRHHWGTDLDIYDPTRLPEGQKLRLEPWEYEQGGYFYDLSCWLTKNMDEFGFYRPFTDPEGTIGVEPWHISYRPLASEMKRLLTPEILLAVWKESDISGYQWLSQHIDMIFSRYILSVH